MSILIVQISDTHLLADTDVVLARSERISQAIAAEFDPSVAGAVLIDTGDSTQSGRADQFRLAHGLITAMRSRLMERAGGIPIEILSIPGNHDCDLSGDQTARELLVEQSLEAMTSASVKPLILESQAEYFDFARLICGPDRSLSRDRPFYRHVDLVFAGDRLRFHLLNSAWMSTRREKMGSIKFPLDAINPPEVTHAAYSISAIHHPFHWFKQPDTMRPLRDRLESISDLILTGHEHEPLAFTKAFPSRDEIAYLEGGALQERGVPTICSFNVIRIDLAQGRKTVTTYGLAAGGFFAPLNAPVATPLSLNRGRIDRPFRLEANFEIALDQIDLPINHPRRNKIRLSDIFIYPDLRTFKKNSSEVLKRTKSEDVLETLISCNRVLVTGSEKSGKTSLARRLFIDLHGRGEAPLLLNAGDLKNSSNPDTLRKTISRLVKDQYEALTPEEYEQIDFSKKTLIVDNLEEIPVDRGERRGVFEYFEGRFSRMLVIGGEEFCLEEIYGGEKRPSALVDYKRYDICEFGFVLLEALTRKWLNLSGGHDEDGSARSEDNVRLVFKEVEQVLRINAIPHHPWVLIALLQNADSAQGPAAKNGSYGHLFEAIITFALDGSRYKKIDIRGKYTILSEYAFELLGKNVASLSEDDVARFFRKYRDSFEIDLDAQKLCEDLAGIGLLRVDEGRMAFSSKFTYCFFVAHYLARHIHEGPIRAIVRTLSERLYHEESANIVVFLAHLSNDPIVLDEMNRTSSMLFAEYPLANFGDDVKPINDLYKVDMKLSLPGTTPEENRRLDRDARDESLARRGASAVDGRRVRPKPDEVDSEVSVVYTRLQKIKAAKRTIQILGQVLRNGAASIPGQDKRRIVHAIFRLGRRLLGMLYFELPGALPEWRSELMGRYHGEHGHESGEGADAKAIEEAHRHIFELYWLVTLGVITIVSESVGLGLLRETFERVVEEDDSLPNQMFNLSIKLESPGNLPNDEAKKLHKAFTDNQLIQLTLRSLVVNHLYLYDVPREPKQRICNELNISLPNSAVGPRQKIIAPRHKKKKK